MAKEGGPEKVVSELSKWESMQPHILLAWMNCAHDIIEKVDLEKLGQLGEISLAIISQKIDATHFDSIGVQAINILHRCVSNGYDLEQKSQLDKAIKILVTQFEMDDTQKYYGTAVRRCLEVIGGQNQALLLLHKTQVKTLHSFIWPMLDQKRMVMRLKVLRQGFSFSLSLLIQYKLYNNLIGKYSAESQ